MSKRPEYRVGVGAPSIVMIFVVLILTTLGVLSYASAKSDLTLTERRVDQVEAYYEANAQAEALLAEIDRALLQAGDDADAYEAAVAALADIDSAIEPDGMTALIRLPVRDTQALHVTLDILPPGEPTRYTVAAWTLINTQEWEPDAFIQLSY